MAHDIIHIVHAWLLFTQVFAQPTHVPRITRIKRTEVASVGELAIHHWVLRMHVGFVKVVRMFHVRAPQASFDHDGRIGSNQHRNHTSTRRRSGSSGCIQRQVTSNHNGFATVPGRGLDPVDRIRKRIEPTVACVGGINPFHLRVAVLLEQRHQGRLDRFRLVNDGFGSDFEAANLRV